MKSHSLWFIKEDQMLNAQQIIQNLGTVDRSQPLSKQFSRYGLHFSTCKSAGVVENIQFIDDIYSSQIQRE